MFGFNLIKIKKNSITSKYKKFLGSGGADIELDDEDINIIEYIMELYFALRPYNLHRKLCFYIVVDSIL